MADRKDYPGYSIIVEDPPDANGASEWLETTCVAPCEKLHRIGNEHSDYARVKAALEQGDRSLVFCYHTCPDCRESMWNCQCRKRRSRP